MSDENKITGQKTVIKNPLLASSVTGLTFDDFTQNAVLFPAAPPMLEAETTDIKPSIVFNPQPGIIPVPEDNEDFSEISLDRTSEPQLYPAPIQEYNPLQDLDSEPKQDSSYLDQAKASFEQLPAVASTVFSTFSNIIKGASPSPYEEKRNPVQTNVERPKSTLDELYEYQNKPENFEALSGPGVLPPAPKFFSPSDLPALGTSDVPPATTGNTYRLGAIKKKTYAHIPGLSSNVPPASLVKHQVFQSQQPLPPCQSPQQQQQKSNKFSSLLNIFEKTPVVPFGVDKFQPPIEPPYAAPSPISTVDSHQQQAFLNTGHHTSPQPAPIATGLITTSSISQPYEPLTPTTSSISQLFEAAPTQNLPPPPTFFTPSQVPTVAAIPTQGTGKNPYSLSRLRKAPTSYKNPTEPQPIIVPTYLPNQQPPTALTKQDSRTSNVSAQTIQSSNWGEIPVEPAIPVELHSFFNTSTPATGGQLQQVNILNPNLHQEEQISQRPPLVPQSIFNRNPISPPPANQDQHTKVQNTPISIFNPLDKELVRTQSVPQKHVEIFAPFSTNPEQSSQLPKKSQEEHKQANNTPTASREDSSAPQHVEQYFYTEYPSTEASKPDSIVIPSHQHQKQADILSGLNSKDQESPLRVESSPKIPSVAQSFEIFNPHQIPQFAQTCDFLSHFPDTEPWKVSLFNSPGFPSHPHPAQSIDLLNPVSEQQETSFGVTSTGESPKEQRLEPIENFNQVLQQPPQTCDYFNQFPDKEPLPPASIFHPLGFPPSHQQQEQTVPQVTQYFGPISSPREPIGVFDPIDEDHPQPSAPTIAELEKTSPKPPSSLPPPPSNTSNTSELNPFRSTKGSNKNHVHFFNAPHITSTPDYNLKLEIVDDIDLNLQTLDLHAKKENIFRPIETVAVTETNPKNFFSEQPKENFKVTKFPQEQQEDSFNLFNQQQEEEIDGVSLDNSLNELESENRIADATEHLFRSDNLFEFKQQNFDDVSTYSKDVLLDGDSMAANMNETTASSSTMQTTNIAYRPVYKHWFFKRDIETKVIWAPFSMSDSLALEDALAISSKAIPAIVHTDGGRYDVLLPDRVRTPVYWNELSNEVRRCSWFFKGVDSRFVPYEEDVADLLETEYMDAATTGEWHRKITIPNGETVVFHGPSVIVHFLQTQNPDSWGNTSPVVPQTTNRPRVVKRGVDEFHIDDGEPEKIDHVLFMVHGIGEACDLKFRPVEEVVDEFRSISMQLVQSHYRSSVDQAKVGRVEILPISWHNDLHSEESGIDKKLKAITLESIPKLRNFTNDTLLDILFYTSPVFCQNIISAVGNSLNRLYTIFCERNPSFSGGVSLAGHSLGSLILFDILCHQKNSTPERENSENPDGDSVPPLNVTHHAKHRPLTRTCSQQINYEVGPAGTGQPYITYPQLDFRPNKFFALGSPIGMFVTIRGIDALGLDFKLPTCEGFYNIFHPYDPVAYRVEALVNPELSQLRPVLIPHHKGRKRMHLELKETMVRVSTDIKQRVMDTFRNTMDAVYAITSITRPDAKAIEKEVDKVIECQIKFERGLNSNSSSSDIDVGETDLPLGKLNSKKRIDYVLQEAPVEFFNEYLFALTSHVCYWDSEDTMLFLMKEIYSSNGIQADSQIPQQTMTIERPLSDVLDSNNRMRFPSTSSSTDAHLWPTTMEGELIVEKADDAPLWPVRIEGEVIMSEDDEDE